MSHCTFQYKHHKHLSILYSIDVNYNHYTNLTIKKHLFNKVYFNIKLFQLAQKHESISLHSIIDITVIVNDLLHIQLPIKWSLIHSNELWFIIMMSKISLTSAHNDRNPWAFSLHFRIPMILNVL